MADSIPNYMTMNTLKVVASRDPRQPKEVAVNDVFTYNRQDVVYIQEILLGPDFLNAEDYRGKIYSVRLENRAKYLISTEELERFFGFGSLVVGTVSPDGRSILGSVFLNSFTAKAAIVSMKDLGSSLRLTMADGSTINVTELGWESIVQFTQIPI